jgi:hypothetical protein
MGGEVEGSVTVGVVDEGVAPRPAGTVGSETTMKWRRMITIEKEEDVWIHLF